MNFTKMLSEQEHLYKGRPTLLMESNATLHDNARAIEEQKRDILYLLADLDVEQIQTMDEALDNALRGFVAFAQSLDGVSVVADELRESNSPEVPQLAAVLTKLREHAADQGSILKSLKQVTKKILSAQPQE